MTLSKAQQNMACAALSIKRGETSAEYSPDAAEMAASTDEETLAKWCGADTLESDQGGQL